MSYIPRLKEEEALLLMLRVLIDERKGQATVREIKERIEDNRLRSWSDQDAMGNTLRSGAPMWHQIVQNASDRLHADRHFYRASFIRTVSTSPQKVLQITNEGRRFVRALNDFQLKLRGDGFKIHHYLDESPLENRDVWDALKRSLKAHSLRYERGNERDDLLRSLRSQKYAIKHHPDYENAGIHTKMLNVLQEQCGNLISVSVDAWVAGRNYVGGLANLESRTESQIARLKHAHPAGELTPES